MILKEIFVTPSQIESTLTKCFFFVSFRRIDFPPEVIRGESLYTNMVIDETSSQPSNNCDDVFVYITDTVEPGKTKRKKTFILSPAIIRNHA